MTLARATLLVVVVFAACKRETTAEEPVRPRVEPKPIVRGDEDPAALAPTTADTPTVTGFDQKGSTTCLPLDAGRQCLDLKTPLQAACEQAKGQVLRCEDCRPLCTVALK